MKSTEPRLVRFRALARNAAIWPRVTLRSGQNRLLDGGLQPIVIPAVASFSMSASKIEPLSSVKSTEPRLLRFRALERKAAI